MKDRHVLVLQHAAEEGPGLIARALEARGLGLRFARPFAGDPVPSSIDDVLALVVMGGPMGVYETNRYPHLRKEMQLIEQGLGAGCPVLGVCLGSQLLASALGARVAKGARKEIGWHRVTLTEEAFLDPMWKGVESSFVALHWHGDVFDLPREATALARSELTPHQAFRYGTSAYGLLFHLEVTSEILAAMAAAFPADLAEVGETPASLLRAGADHLPPMAERSGKVFAAFADLVASRRDGAG